MRQSRLRLDEMGPVLARHDASKAVWVNWKLRRRGSCVWRGGSNAGVLVVECYGSRDEHKQTGCAVASAPRQDPASRSTKTAQANKRHSPARAIYS
jgi:hypothetical protein